MVADATALRHRMVEGLAQRGELDERWQTALTEVPRHVFVPELVWRHDEDSNGNCDLVPLRRGPAALAGADLRQRLRHHPGR